MGMGSEGNATRPMTKEQRVVIFLAMIGHEMNDELTVMVGGIAEALAQLSPDHPARGSLLDLQAAAQRCCWKVSCMINYASRNGAPLGTGLSAAPVEKLLDQGVL